MGFAERVAQEVEWFDGALMTGTNHRHENALRYGARPRAIAAPDLAIHHRRPDGPLGPMVGGLNRRIDQEPEPVHGVLEKVLGQAAIRFVREAA